MSAAVESVTGHERVASAAVSRRRYSRTKRSPLASIAIHTTLIAASFIAVFPIAWVALTSLKTKDGQWAHPGDFSRLNFGN